MQHIGAPQHAAAGTHAGCTPEALQAVLRELNAHSDRYVAELLALRGDYLPMGRRGKDVEDAKDGLRIRAKRYDTQGELRAYGLRSMACPPSCASVSTRGFLSLWQFILRSKGCTCCVSTLRQLCSNLIMA